MNIARFIWNKNTYDSIIGSEDGCNQNVWIKGIKVCYFQSIIVIFSVTPLFCT